MASAKGAIIGSPYIKGSRPYSCCEFASIRDVILKLGKSKNAFFTMTKIMSGAQLLYYCHLLSLLLVKRQYNIADESRE